MQMGEAWLLTGEAGQPDEMLTHPSQIHMLSPVLATFSPHDCPIVSSWVWLGHLHPAERWETTAVSSPFTLKWRLDNYHNHLHSKRVIIKRWPLLYANLCQFSSHFKDATGTTELLNLTPPFSIQMHFYLKRHGICCCKMLIYIVTCINIFYICIERLSH